MTDETSTRGEVALILGGASHMLRPSYEAIVAFEDQTGKALLQLAREGLRGELRTSTVAQIVAECIKAWGRANGDMLAQQVNAPKIARLILEAEGGLADAMTVVSAMLAVAVTGGYTSAGELKAGTMKTPDAIPAEG